MVIQILPTEDGSADNFETGGGVPSPALPPRYAPDNKHISRVW